MDALLIQTKHSLPKTASLSNDTAQKQLPVLHCYDLLGADKWVWQVLQTHAHDCDGNYRNVRYASCKSIQLVAPAVRDLKFYCRPRGLFGIQWPKSSPPSLNSCWPWIGLIQPVSIIIPLPRRQRIIKYDWCTWIVDRAKSFTRHHICPSSCKQLMPPPKPIVSYDN